MDALANRLNYKVNFAISIEDFIRLIHQSPFKEMVPTDNLTKLDAMLNNADLLVSAWDDEQVVGFVRTVTDFSSCCYICELAVDMHYQKHGIDRQLMRLVAEELPAGCQILFFSTDSNLTEYLKLGFTQSPRAWHTTAENFLVRSAELDE
ncbi:MULTISPECIES: GNAT family N-acetyltransferase [Providencia]|uniref:GNAT family N-acetyltransferase n=1 Tax=Providencia rettgeri TaxID=587 RepID=A0A264VVB4_PRORE|nr:GNAT family N-acetyltransferase [Providencia rettgeri]OZS75259.1 GNAT family N-acetyltransferase [Providencia rettgeri]